MLCRTRHVESNCMPNYSYGNAIPRHSLRRSARFLSGRTHRDIPRSVPSTSEAHPRVEWWLGRKWTAGLTWFRNRSAVKRLLLLGFALCGCIYVRGTTAIPIWSAWWWLWIILTVTIGICIGWIANDEHRSRNRGTD